MAVRIVQHTGLRVVYGAARFCERHAETMLVFAAACTVLD
jgi:hypothetical protein